jgi:hypothetical protein
MWRNRELVVFRIQYFSFSVVPDVSASGQLNDFSCVRCHNIYFSHVHKFFRVSGLGISARARGNFMCNSILRHTFAQFAIRWAGMWNLPRRGTCKRRAAWQKTLYIR